MPSVQRQPSVAEELVELGKSDTAGHVHQTIRRNPNARAFVRFTQDFLEGEIISGLFKKLQSANAPVQYMVCQSTSLKSRSSRHRALRLSQPTDSVKKRLPTPFSFCRWYLSSEFERDMASRPRGSMAFNPDTASLIVQLESKAHSSADVRFVVDALDGIVCAGIWAALFQPNALPDEFRISRSLVEEEIRRGKSQGRFFPAWEPFHEPEWIDASGFAFDPLDPMDAGVRDGMNSFLRRTIWHRDRELYARVFGIAEIKRIEHSSPLLVELAVLIAGATFLPGILIWGIMRAVASGRKSLAEAKIRESESGIREEELKQKKLQTEILEEVVATVKERGHDSISQAVVEKAAQISTTAVNDLGSSPLIGSITVGLSAKS